MLDKNGFHKKTYSELLDEMEVKAKELFGAETRLTSDGFFGIFLKLFAWFLSIVWELAERVYLSAFLSDAEGVQLDRIGGNSSITREPDKESDVSLLITGTPNFLVKTETQFTTESNISFMLIEDVLLDVNGTGSGQAVCMIKGTDGNVGANTIILQAEPIEEIISVTNPLAATGGMNQEDDTQYRLSIRKGNEGKGSGTPNAIIAAVKEQKGVRSAVIRVNNTNLEANGLPPKSFQVFTLGGDPNDIAQAIFSKAPAGIESFGITKVTINDSGNNPHVIGFTTATIVNVLIEVTIKTDSSFPADRINQIRDEIIKVIGGVSSNGTTNSGLNMGDEVIIFQIEKAVGKVDGIIDASVKVGRDWQSLQSSNLTIEENEVAQIDIIGISVVEL